MKHERDFQHILVYVYGFFTTIVAFWVYVKTLAPTVSFFDSGELISAAYTLGVAHPPGYPLYVMLGWMFSHLPLGENIAYRLNLMSAFFAALATLMVYCLTYYIITDVNKDLTGIENLSGRSRHPEPKRMLQPVVAMSAAFSFTFSITHWRHAVIAEVYSLNAFLCGLIMLLLLVWRKTERSRQQAVGNRLKAGEPEGSKQKAVSSGLNTENPTTRNSQLAVRNPQLAARNPQPATRSSQPAKPWLLYLVAFLFGIGFGNHQTIILLSLAACFLVLSTAPRILRHPKTLFLIFLALLLGLSVYVMVPLRAAQQPPINWGNPSTLRQFTWLLTREGYQHAPKGDAVKTLWNDLRGQPGDATNGDDQDQVRTKGIERISQVVKHSLFWKQLHSFDPLAQFGYFGMTLAMIGLMYSLVTHRVATLTLLIGVCSLVVIVVLIGDPPPENIFLVEEFHTPAYLLMAVWIGLGIMACSRAVLWVAFQHRMLQYTLVFVLAAFFLIQPASQMVKNLPEVDRRRNYVAYDYATNVLTSLQPNAILFTWGDSGAFPLWYLQIVEEKRPDVTIIHVPHLSASWFIESLPPELFGVADPAERYGNDILAFIDDIVRKHIDTRSIYFDFSSAHSLLLPYPLLPNGITYKIQLPGDQLDNTVWDRYQFRGILDNTRIARDPDIDRTSLMYGSARTELGNYYLEQNDMEKAAHEFNMAVQLEPGLGEGIAQSLEFRDKLAGEQSSPVQPVPTPAH